MSFLKKLVSAHFISFARTPRAFLFTCLLAASQGAHAQFTSDSVWVDNQYRHFFYQAPATPMRGLRLVFVLHGSGGTGKNMVTPAAALQQKAAEEGLLLVYPNGFNRYWNECRKGANTQANLLDINEQGFFNAMVKVLYQRHAVDTATCFAIGYSGGGHMAYKLALTLPQKFKAISAVVANLPDTANLDCVEAKQPVAVMITNGTLDPLNRYEGGDIIIDGSNWGAVRSTDRTFQYWASVAGYTGHPTVVPMPDTDTTNDQSITRFTYRQKGKPEISLLQVKGGTHAFPKDLDIFLESWAFFKRSWSNTHTTKLP